MAKVNYLLGRAEKLVRKIDPPKMKPAKAHPYSFAESVKRVAPKMEVTAVALASIPQGACPSDEAVAMLTLHPSYLAKSYFPSNILDEANLRAVGSRYRTVSPDKWAKKNAPESALTAEIFIAGKRDDFKRLPGFVRQLSEATNSAIDVQKIYDFRTYPLEDRVRTPNPKIEMLHDQGSISDWEYKFSLSVFGKRSLTGRQLAKKKEVNERMLSAITR